MSVCVPSRVHVCACRSQNGAASKWPAFHMGKRKGPISVTTESTELRLEQAAKSWPELPSLFSFRRFQSQGCGSILCQGRPQCLVKHLSSFLFIHKTGLLCRFYPLVPLVCWGYSLWHIRIAELVFYEALTWTQWAPACCERNKKSYYALLTTVPPGSLVSMRFHGVENQGTPRLCLQKTILLCFNNTWAVPCFWLCYSVHLTSPQRSSRCRFVMFCSFFDVLVNFLHCVRGIDVRQKFIFGVFLLLNSIFSAY